MPDPKGNLLPVYVLADESYSLFDHAQELNHGLVSLCDALRAEPMIAAKVRLSILGFSDDVEVRLALADLRDVENLPSLRIRNNTNYQAVFKDLLTRIPHDVDMLKTGGYLVHRPAVFFLSDGQPNDDSDWLEPRERLTNKKVTPAAPNIIAFGIGDVMAEDNPAGRHRRRISLSWPCQVRTSAPQSLNSSSRLRIASWSPDAR